jgi:phosphatidylglycerophosphate synthase
MFDALLRPLIDRGLNPAGRWVASKGVSANQITVFGVFLGFMAFVLVARGYPFVAFWLIISNRIADGLDGAVARANSQTDFGGYLDLVVDFVFYSAIPLAFAIADPENAIAACFLCVSFMGTASSFLGFAILAAKYNIETNVRGKKSFYHLGGLTEGTETTIVLCAMVIWPAYFIYFALGFGLLCCVTTSARIYMTYAMFPDR